MLHEEDGAPVGCVFELKGRSCKSRSDIHRHQAVALCSEVSPTGRCSRCDAMRASRLAKSPGALSAPGGTALDGDILAGSASLARQRPAGARGQDALAGSELRAAR